VNFSQKRKEWLKGLPFVTWQKEVKDCDGIKWNKVPMKAVWHPKTHKRQPEEMLDPYRCQNAAHWKFKSLKRSDAKDGVYCMDHLLQQMTHNREYERSMRYWRERVERAENG
jgi:hypothetical protein